MRIRSIKPEFWRSPDIACLSIEDRLLFIGLWSYVDDNGVGVDRDAVIAADLFADDLSRDPRDTLARVAGGLARLSAAGRIVRYTVDDRDFLEVVNWSRHQRIDRPAKPRHPHSGAEGAVIREGVATVSRQSRETPATGTGEQGNRGTEEQGNSNPPNPPRGKRGSRLATDWRPSPDTIAKITTDCPGLDYAAEHEIFTDYWIAQPGQKGVKVDWDATWRNWMRRKHSEIQTRRKPTPSERAAQTMQLGPRLATELDLKEIA